MRSFKISLLVLILPIKLVKQLYSQNFPKNHFTSESSLAIKTLTVFFIFLSINGEMNCQTGKAKSLEIGNRWVYIVDLEDTQWYEFQDVIGDTIFNDTIYATVYKTWSFGGNPEYVYERADSTKLFRYYTQTGYETTLVDFNLNVGDSMNSYVVTSKHIVTIWEEPFIKMCMYCDFPGLVWFDECHIEKIGLTWLESDGLATNHSTKELKVALIEGEIYGDTTLLNIEDLKQISPNQIVLLQNYPNPFNPVTKIKYEIPASLNPSKGGTLVQIIVYDILGREVTVLVNAEKQAGVYESVFDGSNLPSGVYFYRLTAGEFSDTKKLVLLK